MPRAASQAPFWTPAMAGSPIRELCLSLESEFTRIRKECDALLRPLLNEDYDSDSGAHAAVVWEGQREGLHSGVWLRCELYARGRRHAQNLAALPTLARLLDTSHALLRDPPGRTCTRIVEPGVDRGRAPIVLRPQDILAQAPPAEKLSP